MSEAVREMTYDEQIANFIMFTVPNVTNDLLKHIGLFGKMEVCRERTGPTAGRRWMEARNERQTMAYESQNP